MNVRSGSRSVCSRSSALPATCSRQAAPTRGPTHPPGARRRRSSQRSRSPKPGEPVSQPLIATTPTRGPAATEADPNQQTLGEHKPLSGTKIDKGAWGEVTFALFASVRYLNQHGLDPTFDDGGGTSLPLDRRDDLQFQKVMFYFKGWLGLPAFGT